MTLPPWFSEPVVIAPPDPAWPALAEAECVALRDVLAPWLAADVEHVGSTSVPGLAAKPVLDLMAGMRSLLAADQVVPTLTARGWFHVPIEVDGQGWRRFLVKARDGHRYAHLHLVEAHGPQWRVFRLFRDSLRADATLRHDYSALKQDLAARLGDRREAYTDAKAAFIQQALDRASGRFPGS